MNFNSIHLFVLVALFNYIELISSFDRMGSGSSRMQPTEMWYNGLDITNERWGNGNRVVEHVLPHLRTITSQYAHNVAIEEEKRRKSPTRSLEKAHNPASNVKQHLDQNVPTNNQYQIDLKHPPQHINYPQTSIVTRTPPQFSVTLRPEQVRYQPVRKRNNN